MGGKKVELAAWKTLMVTMAFASLMVAVAIIIAERFGGVWAPVWIICFLVGMSILFDFGGVRQTELNLVKGGMLFACGPMLWPVLALGQDYINEFYGKKIAINYTIGMFLAKIGTALGTLWIIFQLPIPTSSPELANVATQFNTIMIQSPRMNIASIAAVVAAFFANAWVYDFLRKRTKGKRLWLRNIISSATALTIDGFVFFYGAFSFVLPWIAVWDMTISYLMVCYVTIIIDVIFLYGMVAMKRNKMFGIDERIGKALVIQTLKAHESDDIKQVTQA
jgi:uncharacterized integral membrane protein (TIGR00697 family)